MPRGKAEAKKEKTTPSQSDKTKQKKAVDKKGKPKPETEETKEVTTKTAEAEVKEENGKVADNRQVPLDPPNFDYDFLLNNIRDKLAKPLSTGERWAIPEVEVIYEGKSTVLRNFSDIVSKIRREGDHLFAFLLKELGTSGTTDNSRIIFKGRISQKQIQDRLNSFVKEFVLCTECKKPDTHFEKEGRVTILVCEVCGAKRPVNIRKAIK
ncbi:MAG: translation initiation factor IF-2 subunit beta [Thermoplasmata archaeon]